MLISFQMASKKFTQSKSPSFSPIFDIARLSKDCHILDNVQIRPLTAEEENRWRFEGLGSGLLVLGKRHIDPADLIYSTTPSNATQSKLSEMYYCIYYSEQSGEEKYYSRRPSLRLQSQQISLQKFYQAISDLLLYFQKVFHVLWKTTC